VSQVFSQWANERTGQSAEFKFNLIDVAPSPVLAGFDGPDNRMTYSMIVFCRVFVLRRVTATHMATDQAKAKVYPDIAHLQAFFAAAGMRFDILNLAGV